MMASLLLQHWRLMMVGDVFQMSSIKYRRYLIVADMTSCNCLRIADVTIVPAIKMTTAV